MASDPAKEKEADGTAKNGAAAAAGANPPEASTDVQANVVPAKNVSANNATATGGSITESAHPCGAARERTDPRTLEMLVCPVTKLGLEYDEKKQELISRRAYLAYPIRCGVPLLTREAARALDS